MSFTFLTHQARDGVLAGRKADVFLLHVEFERPVAAVAADAAGLDAAEGGGQVADVFRVHPDHARFQSVGEPQRPRQVVGPDVAGQAVGNVIGDLKCFFFRTEADGGQDRAEDFFLGDLHGVVRTGEEGRTHEAAFRPDAAATSGNRCAVLAGGFEVAGHLVEMGLVDQRADFGLWVEGMTDLMLLTRSMSLARSIGNRVLHQKARGRGAALAIERIDHEDRRIQRPVEISIVENDHGFLPPSSKCTRFRVSAPCRMIMDRCGSRRRRRWP